MTISGKTLAQEKKFFLNKGINPFAAAMLRGSVYAKDNNGNYTSQNHNADKEELCRALCECAESIIGRSDYMV